MAHTCIDNTEARHASRPGIEVMMSWDRDGGVAHGFAVILHVDTAYVQGPAPGGVILTNLHRRHGEGWATLVQVRIESPCSHSAKNSTHIPEHFFEWKGSERCNANESWLKDTSQGEVHVKCGLFA
jgi:hypothetical protein